MVTLGRWLKCEFAVCVAERERGERRLGGGVRKAGEGQGDVLARLSARGIAEERESFFQGGMNLDSLQLSVIFLLSVGPVLPVHLC